MTEGGEVAAVEKKKRNRHIKLKLINYFIFSRQSRSVTALCTRGICLFILSKNSSQAQDTDVRGSLTGESVQIWLPQLVLPAHLPELLPLLARTLATEVSSDTVFRSQSARENLV